MDHEEAEHASELAIEFTSIAKVDPAIASALREFLASYEDSYSFEWLVDGYGPDAAPADRSRLVDAIYRIQHLTPAPVQDRLAKVVEEVLKPAKPRPQEPAELSPQALQDIVAGLMKATEEKLHAAMIHAVATSRASTKAALDRALKSAPGDEGTEWKAVLRALSFELDRDES